MRIAIYGDNFLNIKQIKRVLYIFSNCKKLELVVDVISNEEDMLSLKQNYVLIFLSFESKNSIMLAHRLYKNKKQIPIIAFSANPCHAVEAYKINAYNFLQLPLCEEMLYKMLENFFTPFLSVPIMLCDGFESICINTEDILYLEANNKHCYIHLNNESFYCNKTMARVYEILTHGHFLKISRSIIVNSDCIARFSSKQIILTNAEVLYPSRHFYKTFKSDYTALKMPKIP